jgi:SAM-dependent methyltransferase
VAFFGELYLRSTLPFLTAQVTHAEVGYLARAFKDLTVDGPLLDVGCGHGRHSALLDAQLRPARRVLGVELDAASLAGRSAEVLAVRGDFRALPLASQAFAGAFAWYSTLFVLETDEAHLAALRELHRCLKPGGRLVVQTVPFERLAQSPRAGFQRTLPDGALLEESSLFDPETGIDEGKRTLRLPDGRVLSGTYRIRYYPLPRLQALFDAAGFSFGWAHGDLEGRPLESRSHELILGVDVRHA